MEKYSVLMSLYRKEDPAYLREALDSMLSQTAPPDEIVLVEDGPLTEELYAVVSAYSDKAPGLFTIIVNEENMGLGASLNRGLTACRNELIARMDTDDISKPSRCEKQLRRFEEEPGL
ncbi:MAG: glycosyltransferase, partial [Firmicutes bacterium]|nr:glycosyltransferase [Bacillota bacterium]